MLQKIDTPEQAADTIYSELEFFLEAKGTDDFALDRIFSFIIDSPFEIEQDTVGLLCWILELDNEDLVPVLTAKMVELRTLFDQAVRRERESNWS